MSYANIDWGWLGMQVVDNAAGVFVAEALGVQDRLSNPNDSATMRAVKMGVVWEIINEGILLVKHGSSHLLEGHYYVVVDDVFFNSATWMALERSGLGEKVTGMIDDKLPFGNDVNSAIATGVIKVAAKVWKDLIDAKWANTPLGYLTSITKIIGVQESAQGGIVTGLY